ncbi:MAG: S8 family peptidase [Chloroflexi bacterium]|nr:S8 family peptidase [Chloroflexota bacterium]
MGAMVDLSKVESISAFTAESKLRSIPEDRSVVLLEVLLHNADDQSIITSFLDYASSRGEVFLRKRRDIGGLTFIPVEAPRQNILDIARYSFVRVCRGMPSLRPIYPGLIRSTPAIRVTLPVDKPMDVEFKAVIFDGGIPKATLADLSKWVSLSEPKGIGPAVPAYEQHGLAVTGAFLFGVLSNTKPAAQPICSVEHVRVIDQRDASSNDMEYVDVIERITDHLDTHPNHYKFVNLSIGPSIPITDDEVSYWTLALDQRFASADSVVAVAVGNSGGLDHASGLDRIQPPSDAVNVLSVGAADSNGPFNWGRASYSSVGPGRSPGLVKPDGLAFGGSTTEPFNILHSVSVAVQTSGTSFAAPIALRSSAAISAQLGLGLKPLTVRALMVHQAEDGGHDRSEVGWGRFETDPARLITCPDDSMTAVYQGELPVGISLRVPIPIPADDLSGYVTITATLLIAPNIDPGFVGDYTESGFIAVLRPHSQRFTHNHGKRSAHPRTVSFFCEGGMYGKGEFELREGGLKWEPCVRRSRRFLASSLYKPCFDIYYHNREDGLPAEQARPIPYALIVTVYAPKVPNLYDCVVRTYANVLVPIQPRLRIRVTT